MLKTALTHTSYAHEAGKNIKHNERLEFLGDTILNLAITDKIYKHTPEITEGNMSKIRATIICEECLSRNYTVDRNKLNNPNRIVIKKYCKKCNKHTVHKETK